MDSIFTELKNHWKKKSVFVGHYNKQAVKEREKLFCIELRMSYAETEFGKWDNYRWFVTGNI
jgi:hypothetical protein